jgi:hypothetical protein
MWQYEDGLCFGSTPTKVSFYARGAQGAEELQFSAASSGDLIEVTLSNAWVNYTIPLTAVDSENGEWKGFVWAASEPAGSIKFYIDDIRWVAE